MGNSGNVVGYKRKDAPTPQGPGISPGPPGQKGKLNTDTEIHQNNMKYKNINV